MHRNHCASRAQSESSMDSSSVSVLKRSNPRPTLQSQFIDIYLGIGIALLAIYVRSCFRVAELQGGFQGELANDEITFMILEGAMIVIASTALTGVHPGIMFGKSWGAANMHHGQHIEMKG